MKTELSETDKLPYKDSTKLIVFWENAYLFPI